MNKLFGFQFKDINGSISSVFVVGKFSSLFHSNSDSKEQQLGVKRVLFLETNPNLKCNYTLWTLLFDVVLAYSLSWLMHIIGNPLLSVYFKLLCALWPLSSILWWWLKFAWFSESEETVRTRQDCCIRMALENPEHSSASLWTSLKMQVLNDYSLQLVNLPLLGDTSSNVILHNISLLEFLTALYEEIKVENSARVRHWNWVIEQIKVNPYRSTVRFEPC